MNRRTLLFSLLLSDCTAALDGTGPEPGTCTRDYIPVCGQIGPDRQTFMNACVARAVGYRIIAKGECSG